MTDSDFNKDAEEGYDGREGNLDFTDLPEDAQPPVDYEPFLETLTLRLANVVEFMTIHGTVVIDDEDFVFDDTFGEAKLVIVLQIGVLPENGGDAWYLAANGSVATKLEYPVFQGGQHIAINPIRVRLTLDSNFTNDFESWEKLFTESANKFINANKHIGRPAWMDLR